MKKFRGLALVLIIVLLMNTLAYAEVVDVTEDDWSEPYVTKVVDTDVMPVYASNEFKPSERVTKMEVLNVLYRIALLKGDITTNGADTLLDKYQDTIDGLLIPNVLEPYGANNHRAIAYALEKGIVRSSELSLFYINGSFEVISKVDASVYVGKALNVYLQENVNKFYEIRYKDGGEITLMAWPYVNLLIEKEIVSKDGNNGYYYPNSMINRDVFSVFASGMLREIENYTPNETNDFETVASDGKISIIHYDKNIVEIRDSLGNLKVYDATNAEITLNGEVVAIQNLEAGVDVKISASGNKLVSIEVIQEYDTKVGKIVSIGNEVTLKGETFRPLGIETTKIEFFKTYNSIIVERDYQTVTMDDLKEGDEVTVHYKDLYAKKIVAFSEKVVLDGALQRATQFNVGDAVSIKLSNGKLLEQVIENSVTKTNVNEDMTKGDIVKVTLVNGKITSVEATGLSTEASGRVTEIVIGQNSRISIVNNKGLTKSYNIAKDVVVKNLGTIDTDGLYALRLDQDVNLELSGVSVNLISIEKAVDKTQFQAKITEIHKNINLIKAVDNDNKTWIVSLEGSDQNIADYTVGDDVFIYGVELSADLFEADLIIILE